ncbi:Zinc transporter ZIP14 [Nymphon striatum]|nr:Zinc transporter ZIP14 [Nymphon striatum]
MKIIFHDYLDKGSTDDPVENFQLTSNKFKDWLENIYNPDVKSKRNVTKCKSNSSEVDELFSCVKHKKCLSAEQLLSLSEQHTPLSIPQIQEICPLILNQVQESACRINEENKKIVLVVRSRPTVSEVWGYGILFVTVISLLSLCGIALFPLMGKEFYKKLLTYLIGLAVGSLLSSAIFHLIPQTFGLLSSGNHEYLWKSIVIVAGVYLFYFTERIMRIIMLHRQRKRKAKGDSTKETPEKKNYVYSELALDKSNVENHNFSDKEEKANYVVSVKEENNTDINNYKHHVSEPHTLCHHDHEGLFHDKESSTIATVAYMIIFGDGLHNFIDGLSIGAAFSENILAGISISVAIICDFAVLLNAGMSSKQAILYNFLSACTCYCGLIIGILLGELDEASTYIFALAAGMFLYISLVDMLPEMNLTAEEASSKSVILGLKVLFIQSMGMATGIIALFFLALYNEQINFEN